MATKEQLRELITTRPFQPFVVRMTGGRTFTVQHPENAACDHRGRNLIILDQQGMHFVEMLLVEAMEPVQEPPAAPPTDKPRKRKGA
jgi:hypothetical protein